MITIIRKEYITHQTRRKYESLKRNFPQLLPFFQERLSLPYLSRQEVLHRTGNIIRDLQDLQARWPIDFCNRGSDVFQNSIIILLLLSFKITCHIYSLIHFKC
jgi:hypothetical protein